MASLKRFSALGGIPPTDPQFNLTTLLLHCDGTNGAQNNTFLDSSSNNFTVTRTGNTTQGTFTPFSQTGWGVNFDGNGDYLFNGEISSYNVASGQDFTVEGWVYLTASGTMPLFIFGASKIAYDADIGILVRSNAAAVRIYPVGGTDGAATTFSANFPSTMPLNQWNHWALVRSSSGTSIRAYLNGVGGTAVTASGAIDPYTRRGDLSGALGIYLGVNDANWTSYTPTFLNGYQSNVRYIVGTALYTADFTPPTSPLTAITNTQYLSCQSNRFIDTSSNARVITPFGNASVQAFSPFLPTTAYSAPVVGGSGYFDGAGDYLSLSDNASLQFGTGTFTIQGWVYRAVAGATHNIASKGASTPTGWAFWVNTSNQLVFTNTAANITTTTTIPLNAWTHVAAVRSGTGTNQMVLFINGVSSATGTVTTNFNQTNNLNIGADRSNANTFNGYISGLEIVKGSALTITVPTTPPTTSNSPSLLLNFTNAGIFDQTAKNNLETVGNAQISTSVTKFGTGSVEFDGTGDVIIVPGRGDSVLFGTGNFTIEFFAWVNSASVRSYLFDTCPLSVVSPTNRILIDVQNNGALRYVTFQGTTVLITSSSGAVTANQWNHIALCKSSGQTRLFLNGTQVGSTYTDTLNYPAQINRPVLGGDAFNNSGSLIGYLDELRITTGFARYTANFAPPTSPFADQ
jgi:hypothetical protein